MVRLRVKLLNCSTLLRTDFNSNMVRLRVWYWIGFIRWRYQFQFQYGAIKRLKKTDNTTLYLHFNSNMVRLRETAIWNNTLMVPNFNSNMVRLRAYSFITELCPDGSFQFQYGAIKRSNSNGCKCGDFYFNSNMVRLRDSLKIGYAPGT